MPPISTLVAKTIARRQSQTPASNEPDSNSVTPIVHAPTAPEFPAAPGAPPQDLPVASPQRGSLPASLVNVSDLNDSQRQFRTGPVRSAVFPYPAPTSGVGSDKIAQIQATIAATQTEQATVTTQAAETAAKVASLNMDTIPEGQNFGKTVQTAMTPLGTVDTTRPGVAAQGGSFPPQIVGTTSTIFSYTATASTSTVVISWSAITLLYPDGTTTTVPSGSRSITGISAGTYYFYPFTLPVPLGVVFVLVSGGSGTPAILYTPQSPTAAQQMNLQSVTALAGAGIPVVMPASGSGGGSGGGSGLCVRSTMFVETREHGVVPIAQCKVGDHLACREGWTEIVAHKVLPQRQFVKFTVQDKAGARHSTSVTVTHHITAMRNGAESSVKAIDVQLSDFLIVRDGYATISSIEFIEAEDGQKVVLTCEPTHTFFSGTEQPQILTSNVQPNS
jgi:hypothetical protein